MHGVREVRENPDAARYELTLDGRLVGVADYRVRDGGDVLVVPHTEIVPELRGNGLGEVLVQGMLDDLRRTGRTVVPQCWFVADYVKANPQYADLVAVTR